ncbi:MAG: N-acetylglucosamine-6-phosphate deacetylase [Pyrinomonadaceae bacterium]|nr:N-acetylglucosamine-6-phosphate deacetylase [Pyrinomonadaceae bacterium]
MRSNSESFVLRGARLVLPHASIDADLLVEEGRIGRIFERAPEDSQSIGEALNLNGLTLFPGFIDVHIHGAMGADVMEASADELHTVARFLARNGVTAWLPTLVPAPDEDYRRAVLAVEELMCGQDQTTTPAAARSLGVHYEGPFVNEGQCGALRTKYFRVYDKRSALDFLPIVELEDAKRMITLAPEVDGGIELIRELRTRGFVVSIGHTRADVETLDQAFDAGARHLTHFMNAMSPLHHRAPGVVGWGLTHDEVTCDVIADGVHLDPLMLEIVLRCKTAKRTLLISDAVAPAGLGDGEYGVWNETITVKDGRTSNERGSIAGSVITMRDAVRMIRNLKVSDQEIARMASFNPAKLLGVETECGTIEQGKRADLVALDEEGNARLTVIGGRIAFNDLQK